MGLPTIATHRRRWDKIVSEWSAKFEKQVVKMIRAIESFGN
jgi:hypothetical protein